MPGLEMPGVEMPGQMEDNNEVTTLELASPFPFPPPTPEQLVRVLYSKKNWGAGRAFSLSGLFHAPPQRGCPYLVI